MKTRYSKALMRQSRLAKGKERETHTEVIHTQLQILTNNEVQGRMQLTGKNTGKKTRAGLSVGYQKSPVTVTPSNRDSRYFAYLVQLHLQTAWERTSETHIQRRD